LTKWFSDSLLSYLGCLIVSTALHPEKHEGPSIARPFENSLEIGFYDQLATPPWRLQAPRRFFACE
jgi:hypothetical protein